MTTVYNTIQKVAGLLETAAVTIELLWDKDTSALAFADADDVSFQGIFQFDSDNEGYWSQPLLPNALITPTDNVYKVTETVDDSSVTYYLTVEDDVDPVFVGDYLVAKPDWVD